MHYGEFIGKNARNILILGESHHISKTDKVDMTSGIKASYSTKDCIIDYLSNPEKQNYLIFDKIVKSFGFNPDEEREKFWHSVCFGNYVNVLCGVGDSTAKNMIKENRINYNNELFTFINRYNISTIFCFSINVYDNGLPSLNKNSIELCEKKAIGKFNDKNVYIRRCLYCANEKHDNVDIILNNNLDVYGIGHPSSQGGYSAELMQTALKGKINLK